MTNDLMEIENNLPAGAESRDVAVAGEAARAQAEIQSAMVVAKKFPRSEATAASKIMKTCERPTFAQTALYSYPRGGTNVEGPSINMAREMARNWGNMRYGCKIIHDDEDKRTIEAFAFDAETNTLITAQDTMEKLIQRKGQGWIKPDERDLRELTNRRAAIQIRNCILQLMPRDIVDDAMAACKKNAKKTLQQEPIETVRRKLLGAFDKIGVYAKDIESYYEKAVDEITHDDAVELRAIYQSICDGNSTKDDYFTGGKKTRTKKEAVDGAVSMNDVLKNNGDEEKKKRGRPKKSEQNKAVDVEDPDYDPLA